MTAKIVQVVTAFAEAAAGLASSYAMTFRHLFRRPITEQYPEFKRILPERTRGAIILTRDPEGGERCVACELCSAVCPTDCITMEGEEGKGGRRQALWFRINFARCIYCGLCEEACPTLAIQLTPEFEFCKVDVENFVYEKEDLLVNHGGKNNTYNFYRHAGVEVAGPRGTHIDESPPVNVRSNLP